MRAVAVGVRGRGIASYKALAIDDARLALIVVQVGQTGVDAAINHGNANIRSVDPGCKREVGIDGRIRILKTSPQRTVRRDVGDVRQVCQFIEDPPGNSIYRRLNAIEIALVLATSRSDEGVMPLGWCACELNNNRDRSIRISVLQILG